MMPTQSNSGLVPILQSITGTNFTTLNILAGKGAKWSFQITPHNPTVTTKEITHPHSLHKIYQMVVTGLSPDTSYTLSIANRQGQTIEQRFFKTFPQNKKEISLAFGSCMNDTVTFLETAHRIWGQVKRLKPDVIVLAGDNVYTTEWHFLGERVPPKANQIWQRYVHNFQHIPLFKFKHLIPVLATWDDHDYGANNGGKSWGKTRRNWNPAAEASKSFHAFFSTNHPVPLQEKGPGVSSRVDILGHRFIFLDNRSFRTLRDQAYAHWGKKQERFLMEQLKSTSAPLLIINGGQFFGGYLKKESFEYNHPSHFQAFKKRMKNLYRDNPNIPPFVLFSGDVHFSEVMQIEREQFGFQTYEFTSSPWHNRTRRVHTDPKYSSRKNPRRITSVEGANFFFVRSSYRDDALSISLQAFGPRGKIRDSSLSLSVRNDQ